MTVSELKALLIDAPDDRVVVVEFSDGRWCDILEVGNDRDVDADKADSVYLRIGEEAL